MLSDGVENYDFSEAKKHAANAYKEIQDRLQAKKDGEEDYPEDDEEEPAENDATETEA